MRTRFFILSACCLALTALPSGAEETERPALTATSILSRMATVYANCKSYRDSGLVKTTYAQAASNWTAEIAFSTAFVRPDHFRFEFKGGGAGRDTGGVIWSNGEEVKWGFIREGIRTKDSLGDALFGAVAESSSTSSNIPHLLSAKCSSNGYHRGVLTGVTDPERLEDADLGELQCFRVKFRPFGSGERCITLWIEQNTLLVRRVDSQLRQPNLRWDSTATYTPVLDQEVADTLLAFKSPDGNLADVEGRWPMGVLVLIVATVVLVAAGLSQKGRAVLKNLCRW